MEGRRWLFALFAVSLISFSLACSGSSTSQAPSDDPYSDDGSGNDNNGNGASEFNKEATCVATTCNFEAGVMCMYRSGEEEEEEMDEEPIYYEDDFEGLWDDLDPSEAVMDPAKSFIPDEDMPQPFRRRTRSKRQVPGQRAWGNNPARAGEKLGKRMGRNKVAERLANSDDNPLDDIFGDRGDRQSDDDDDEDVKLPPLTQAQEGQLAWESVELSFHDRVSGVRKPAEGNSFAAVYVRDGELGLMETNVNPEETTTVSFMAYEANDRVQLRACCDSVATCDYMTNMGAVATDLEWQYGEIACPAGTTKIIFVCESFVPTPEENELYGAGACGLDDVKVVDFECEQADSPDDVEKKLLKEMLGKSEKEKAQADATEPPPDGLANIDPELLEQLNEGELANLADTLGQMTPDQLAALEQALGGGNGGGGGNPFPRG